MTIRIDGTNTTANPGITGADADTGLQFGTDEVQFVTGGTNRATVESNGNLTIEDGNLVVASGHGIDFSGTADGSGTTSSELLDDYEEGTWTPVFAGSTTAGTYTYATQTGLYTKIGNRVIADFRLLDITTGSAGSGTAKIQGLPFTTQSTVGMNPQGSVRMSQFNVADSTINMSLQPDQNDTECNIVLTRDNTSSISVTVDQKINNNADLYGTVIYSVD